MSGEPPLQSRSAADWSCYCPSLEYSEDREDLTDGPNGKYPCHQTLEKNSSHPAVKKKKEILRLTTSCDHGFR